MNEMNNSPINQKINNKEMSITGKIENLDMSASQNMFNNNLVARSPQAKERGAFTDFIFKLRMKNKAKKLLS